jgi:response regulator of citrate/malate metabolism
MTKKVLLIDDDEISNFFNRKLIEKSNSHIDIFTVSSVKDAMEYLRNSKKETLPDIIFLDIFMPVKNGWDFLEEFQNEFKKESTSIKLYMLSSSVYNEDITKANNHYMVKEYICKPLSRHKLDELLH